MKPRKLVCLLLAVAGLIFLIGACNQDNKPAGPTMHLVPIVTPTVALPLPPVPHKPVSQFGDGRYEVVTDILPGQYKTTGISADTGAPCYWARLKDFTGSVTSVNAMQYGDKGPDVVVIEPSDKGFETRACGTWIRVPQP